ncbi:MAG: hypothetical protein IIV93_07240, partial [Clostridia bacterium]|nr:hypothetical protein [Clostridia bacterium]
MNLPDISDCCVCLIRADQAKEFIKFRRNKGFCPAANGARICVSAFRKENGGINRFLNIDGKTGGSLRIADIFLYFIFGNTQQLMGADMIEHNDISRRKTRADGCREEGSAGGRISVLADSLQNDL